MTFGFPAYHQNILKNNKNYVQSDLIQLIQNTKFLINGHTDTTIFINTKMNFFSWGEKIEITLQDDLIIIKSKCANPLQCFDWSQNKLNVLDLIEILQ